jgi:hypothetical protein
MMLGSIAAYAVTYGVTADAVSTVQHPTITKLKEKSITRDRRRLKVLNSKLVSESKENTLSTKQLMQDFEKERKTGN